MPKYLVKSWSELNYISTVPCVCTLDSTIRACAEYKKSDVQCLIFFYLYICMQN